MSREYRCRRLQPYPETTFRYLDADTVEDAAQQYHLYVRGTTASDGVNYAVIEVDGYKYLSRCWFAGIGRKGGLPVVLPTVEKLARDWGLPPEDFAPVGWSEDSRKETDYCDLQVPRTCTRALPPSSPSVKDNPLVP